MQHSRPDGSASENKTKKVKFNTGTGATTAVASETDVTTAVASETDATTAVASETGATAAKPAEVMPPPQSLSLSQTVFANAANAGGDGPLTPRPTR